MADRKLSDKLLQTLIDKKDESVKLGDRHKFDSFFLVMKKNTETEEYEETRKVMCNNCKRLLSKSDGGQLRRHLLTTCKKRKLEEPVTLKKDVENTIGEPEPKVRTLDYYNMKQFTPPQTSELYAVTARYCLRAGRSYNHMASETMRQFIVDILNVVSSGYGEEAKKQIPCRLTIQKYSEEMASSLIKNSYEFLRPYAINGRLNLILDHGKHVVNYLSVYGSFIDEDFKLITVPLAFIPSIDGKSGSETAKLILNRLQMYGWTKEEVLGCTVTADGALGSLQNHFERYIRCVSHSINLMGSNGADPMSFQRKQLLDSEIDILKKGVDVLESAEGLSSAIRTNSDVCRTLSRLPALPGDTRWLSSLKCLADAIDLEEEIDDVRQNLNAKGKTCFNHVITQARKISNSILFVFQDLLEFNSTYQNQNSVTLHLVVPSYKHLERIWTNYENGIFNPTDEDKIDTEYTKVLAKNALLAFKKYYYEFSDYHFDAAMLSPQTKKMRRYNYSEIAKGKDVIMGFFPKETPESVEPEKKVNGVARLLALVADEPEDESNDEYERFLAEYVDKKKPETVEEYWRRKQKDFPNLYQAAAAIYSIVPSESVCETCFSTAGFLLDKRRTRLLYSRAELIVVGSQIAARFPDWVDKLKA